MQYRATAYENILKIQSYLHPLRSVQNFPLDWVFFFFRYRFLNGLQLQ